MPENPFAALELAVHVPESDPKKNAPKPAAKAKNVSVDRSMFFFDFETIPDESRFPRPVLEDVPVREPIPDRLDIDLQDLLGGTIPSIKKVVEQGLSDKQLSELKTIEVASKNRKGVVDAIWAALGADESTIADVSKRNTEAFETWRKEGSVNPLKARIVAFGWAFMDGEVQSLTARNDDEERIILEQFWTLIKQTRRRCGYNIFHFDDLLAAIRSLLLGVPIPKPLDRKRYGNQTAVDLMIALFPSGKPQKCKDVATLLGINPPAGDVDGSQVFDMFYGDQLDAIGEYVRSDVSVERDMYLLLADALVM